ncbi:ABC transporter substrate-binding protein [Leifsonia aquatica]|uniref:ABC transporter substrate-binding protein n=1 Tax=Leifsonia aquatica TaxID=144185 RepID=UPI000468B1EE|nr:sugar ABC transporter substrate-binding protein [Leifsonia aquatica]
MARHKAVLLGATLATVALLTTACSQGGPSGTDEKVTITYSNFSANGGHEKNLQAIADAFHKENPNITVKVENVAKDSYFTKLQTDVAAGNAPDTFEVNYENFSSYADEGALAPLTSVDDSAYQKSLLDAFAYKGTQYGLPTGFQAGILAYNKDLFDKAGVAYPTADWTWDDAEAAAKKITDPAAGVWGLQQPAHFWEFYSTLAAAGGEFFNKDKTKAAFDSQEGLKAFTWLTEKSGVIAPPINEIAGIPDIESTMFKKGQLGMWQVASGALGGLRDTKANWDIQIVPGLASHTSYSFVNMIGVSSGSKHKDAAEKWAKYFTSSSEMVDQRITSSWDLPSISDQSQFQTWIDDAPPANKAAVLEAVQHTVFPPTITGHQTELQDALNDELTAAATKQKTPEQAIKDAAAKVDDLLKQANQ